MHYGHLPGDPVSAVSSSSTGFGRERLFINDTGSYGLPSWRPGNGDKALNRVTF